MTGRHSSQLWLLRKFLRQRGISLDLQVRINRCLGCWEASSTAIRVLGFGKLMHCRQPPRYINVVLTNTQRYVQYSVWSSDLGSVACRRPTGICQNFRPLRSACSKLGFCGFLSVLTTTATATAAAAVTTTTAIAATPTATSTAPHTPTPTRTTTTTTTTTATTTTTPAAAATTTT